MIEFIQQPWPWYVSGVLIGAMVPLLLILANKQFGISSSFRHMCAMLPNKVKYFNYDWKEGSWNLVMALGLVVGGFIANNYLSLDIPLDLSDANKTLLETHNITAKNKELLPSDLFSFNNPLGIILLSIGGFLIGFGTRYADGCTSGHAIMGMSMFNKGSLIAVIGFFIGGLLVTHLILPYIL